MCPGFDSRTRRHMWVEFVVGSCPCSEGFSPGSPVFLPPQKSTFLNSNAIGNSRATGLSVRLLSVTLVKQSRLVHCSLAYPPRSQKYLLARERKRLPIFIISHSSFFLKWKESGKEVIYTKGGPPTSQENKVQMKLTHPKPILAYMLLLAMTCLDVATST